MIMNILILFEMESTTNANQLTICLLVLIIRKEVDKTDIKLKLLIEILGTMKIKMIINKEILAKKLSNLFKNLFTRNCNKNVSPPIAISQNLKGIK